MVFATTLTFAPSAAQVPSNFDPKLDLKIMLVKNIRRYISKRWTDYRRAAGTSEA